MLQGFYKQTAFFDGYYIDMELFSNNSTDNIRNTPSSIIIEDAIKEVLKNTKEDIFYVIDFRNAKLQLGKEFYLKLKERNLIFVGISLFDYNKIKEKLKDIDETEVIVFERVDKDNFGTKQGSIIVGNVDAVETLRSKILKKDGIALETFDTFESYRKFINVIRKNIAGDYLINFHKNEVSTYLPSSNIYANKYFDVKPLFLNSSIYSLVIQDMCILINELRKGQPNITLVGVSVNGAILAAHLSYRLDLQYSFINRLGPEYNYTEIDSKVEIIKNNSCIFISDFICLGSEYIRTRALLESHNKKVIGMVSIACVENIFRKEEKTKEDIKYNEQNDCILTVMGNINKLCSNFNYKISYYKEKISGNEC